MLRVLGRLILLGLVLGAGLMAYGYHWLNSPLQLPPEGIGYQLERGQSLSHVTADLAQREVLKHPRALSLYAQLIDRTRVHAGEYQLEPGLTPQGLLTQLVEGDVILHQVTLIEGWTYQQALEALHAEPTVDAKLIGLSESEQLQRLGLDLAHPEGWFFPDTYRYVRGTTDVALLRRAHAAMDRQLQALWETRATGLPYDSPYEALIMASIIERETGATWERKEIAGVFVRRLQRGMRLQTDPTVIYGMGDRYEGNLSRRDLRTPSDYNTYTISGLPPTPIALPGRGALEAAMNPAEGTALYFVAKGDGTHVFSDTLEAHNRAVREYQLRRREDYRSTPPAAREN
ncbi:endolytic transglycosylase MltG [Marinimicrobium agarilyticum]|uniref:endolytic transglycosylase MltG n=1 Tax=Marinimicrobium agarilyticum TaxID=306546 RepID=UPI000486AA5F|nr:endolytic transglycosylase MltG [Marinimicrobium agarilyticum]